MAVNLNSENFKAEVQGPMTIVDFGPLGETL